MKFNSIKTLALLSTLVVASTAYAAYATYDEAINAARIPFDKENYAEAQPIIEEALTLAKNPSEKANGFMSLGLVYSKRKMYDQAREQWNKILQTPEFSDEDKIGAHILIASSYGDQDKWDEARAEFQEVLKIPGATSENTLAARTGIAVTYLNQGNQQKAREQVLLNAQDMAFEPAVRGAAYTQVGQSFLNTNEPKEAREALNKALNLLGDSPALQAGIHASIAESYKAEGDAQQEKREYGKAQALALSAAQQASNNKDWDTAIALHKQILTFGNLDPFIDAASRSQIGFLLLKDGKTAEAREALEAFAQKNYQGLDAPRQAGLQSLQQNAQIAIAKSYIEEGDSANARTVLQKLLGKKDTLPSFQASAQKLLVSLEAEPAK